MVKNYKSEIYGKSIVATLEFDPIDREKIEAHLLAVCQSQYDIIPAEGKNLYEDLEEFGLEGLETDPIRSYCAECNGDQRIAICDHTAYVINGIETFLGISHYGFDLNYNEQK